MWWKTARLCAGCEDRPFFRYAGGDRLRHFRGDEVILNPQDVTEGMAVSSDPAAAAQMPADASMGAVMMG